MVVLLLFVMFPQLLLWEPNDCTPVIGSMMRLLDAAFRRGCGSAIILGSNGLINLLVLRKEGVIWLISSAVLPNCFCAKEAPVEKGRPGSSQTDQTHNILIPLSYDMYKYLHG